MKKEITTKDLNKILNTNEAEVTACGASLLIDTKEHYIDASITRITNKFELVGYLGNNEIEFTEKQKNIIANFLDNATATVNEFSYDNQFHALSLTF